MLRPHPGIVLLSLAIVAASSLLGCANDTVSPSCALNSECPSSQRCVDGACAPVGDTVADAGPPDGSPDDDTPPAQAPADPPTDPPADPPADVPVEPGPPRITQHGVGPATHTLRGERVRVVGAITSFPSRSLSASRP